MNRLIALIAILLVIATTLAGARPASGPSAATVRSRADAFIVSRVDNSKYGIDANLKFALSPACVLDVIYPKGMLKNDRSGKKYPGVIMFHGGGWIRTSKSTMSTFYNRYLEYGFVVCNAEYRLADNTGQFTPVSTPAPAAVEDALTAAKWFWDHADEYNVDKTRFVVTGASAGGHLALMVGMATPEAKLGPTSPEDFKIAAIVNGYGPSDVSDLLVRGTSFAKQWVPEGARGVEREALAKRVSPVTYARKEMPPVITVQGSRDNTIPVAQNQRFTEVLKKLGADAEIHLVEGAGHGYQTPATAWPDAEKVTFEWLAKHGIIELAEKGGAQK